METTRAVRPFEVISEYTPSGDQPQAIAEAPLRDVVNLMREHGVSQIPLIERGKLNAIVHESDILTKMQKRDFDLNAPAKSASSPIGGVNSESCGPVTRRLR